MKQPGEALAGNLKDIRQERNLSLDKLSELTGVSKSMLRQIEIGQSNPTIATTWKIANGLRIPFTALIREQEQDITLRTFKENDPILGDTSGYRIYPLVPFDPERLFETYYMEIDQGVVLDTEPHQGNSEEHVYVIQGRLEISVDGNIHVVNDDQFISFKANCRHWYKNAGGGTARALMLISYLP